jgi:hypothetical protein
MRANQVGNILGRTKGMTNEPWVEVSAINVIKKADRIIIKGQVWIPMEEVAYLKTVLEEALLGWAHAIVTDVDLSHQEDRIRELRKYLDRWEEPYLPGGANPSQYFETGEV